MAEGFPLAEVGEVDLHGGNADGQEGVQEGYAGVGVGGGIEDDAVVDSPGGLDLVYQVSLVVGLVNSSLQAQGLGRALDEGQKVVEDEGYIPQESTGAFSGTNPSGTVSVNGSSSVTPLMEKLKEAYEAVNTNATIEINQTDSSTGMSTALEGVCDIGMASRALKDEELSGGLTATCIATDGIAVIVNKENSVDGLTSDQVKGIYTGEITDWSGVAE